jgi:hypothetical protein
MELDIAKSGLDKLGHTFGLPHLVPPVPGEPHVNNQPTSFQDRFVSGIILHQLTASFHSTLTSLFAPKDFYTFPPPTPPGDSPLASLKQLAARLEQWRAMLPESLRWRDDQPLSLAEPNPFVMFTLGMGSPTGGYPYAGDVQVALLRTRYYYNKHLLHRAFVFKVLHHPSSVTTDDAQGAAVCLKAGLRWPISMSPPCLSKRLVPMAASWSQNMFGVLVLLHLSRHHPVLARIRANFCGQQFDFEANETLELYIDWLRDMKKTDPGSERCWAAVKELFSLDI